MSAAVTPERLLPHLNALLPKAGPSATFAIYQDGPWTGTDQLVVGDRVVDVRVCPSELAVREELSQPRPEGRPLVMLCTAESLGSDVLARLAKRRLLRLHAWDAVQHLFDVREIDPRLLTERWMAEALVEAAPLQGYEKTGARELDAERAWRALLRHRHGLDLDQGLGAILTWASSQGGASLANVGEQERAATRSYISRHVSGADPVIAAVGAGHGARTIPLGLVARVLADATGGETRASARTLLTVLLGGWQFDELEARAWAQAAESRTHELLDADSAAAQAVLQAADRAAEELQASELSAASNLLTSGLRGRLRVLGAALSDRRSGKADLEAIRVAAERVRAHRLTEYRDLAGMVVRLTRWLSRDHTEQPGTLDAAATLFAHDYSYADWARTALRESTGEAGLDEELRALVVEATDRRREQEAHYSQQLAAWLGHAATGGSLLGVEEVLDRVVAPLAMERPALLVILDGLSHRVAAELLDDLVARGWTELRPAIDSQRLRVLSVLPSVTGASRSSLLAGVLATGVAGDEVKAFAANPALVAASARGGPPKLFHKGQLSDPHGGLAAELRSEIAGDRRVVGTVINAIDDHLARSDQIATPWSATYIPLLRALLDAARDAGRLVIIASDHGHVLDQDGTYRTTDGEHGERWRAPTSPPEDGEVLVEGTRVLVGGGRCVLAWDERVRYAPRKHGYHGGGSAQETVAPLLVIAPGLTDPIAGWQEAAYDPPDWWTGDESETPTPIREEPVAAVPEEPTGQLRLGAEPVATEPAEPGPRWIVDLLSSETFANQRAAAARTPLPDERIAAILGTLAAHGGRLLHDALARHAGIAPLRLTGSLAALRQLLNVDGYPVLTVDEGTGDVVLDLPLLRAQFELEAQ